LFFNSFNIYSSLVIDIQSFGTKNLFPSLVLALLLPAYIPIFIIFKQHFVEFNEEYDNKYSSCCIEKEKVVKMRKLFPVARILENMLIPIFLSI
jgi:hypothetical protein